MKFFVSFLIVCFTFLQAESNKSQEIGIYEHLGEYVDMDMKFTNQLGKIVSLQDMSQGKPTILTFNYHRCAGICSPQLAGLATAIKQMDLIPGKDYNIITTSIDPTDSYSFAAKKHDSFTNIVDNKTGIKQAWNFTVGTQKNINILTDKVGFKYKTEVVDGRVDYLHPGALIIISGDGKITRYLNGIKYLQFDLKLALMEASEGKTGPTIARTLLYCFAYDPASKKYVFQAEKVIAGIILLILLIFFIFLIRAGRKKKR